MPGAPGSVSSLLIVGSALCVCRWLTTTRSARAAHSVYPTHALVARRLRAAVRDERRRQGARSVSRRAMLESEEGCLLDGKGCVLDGEEVDAEAGSKHECTLIYLHGCSCHASEYLEDGFCLPWLKGEDRVPGLRAVLPNAPVMEQPWGEWVSSWHGYASQRNNRVGDAQSLADVRRRIGKLVYAEVERLNGEGHRVFLGGASQGCTVALDVYFRQARRLRLGGFVGSVGFIPNDHQGFSGASGLLESLIADKELTERPVWLQCATDDDEHVPWKSVVKPSLRRAMRLGGLEVREVSGRGHILDDWEGQIIKEFLHAHAPYACK